MDKSILLKNIGLREKEAETYLAILELGSSTIKPIAQRAGLKRTSIYNFIDHLVQLGLITQTNVRGRMHYQAQPPSRLADLQRERLRLIEHTMPEFMSIFNAIPGKPRISYFEGPQQVKNIFLEVLNCQREVLHLFPGEDIIEMIGGVDYLSQIDQQRIAKGISIRTIRFPEKDIQFLTSASGSKFLRQLRFAPPEFKTTIGMGIYDTGKVSYWSSLREGFGILIESQELYILMKQFYEMLWALSTPAKPGQG